jgi:hypothetical protein
MKDIYVSEVKRVIIVCPPRKSSILKALRQLKGRVFKWVYLGENVSQFMVIEHQIGDAGKRIEIGDKLQETAKSLRQAYIDYIGKLSIANNSLLWWAGSLSEKNPWTSKTFLYACYIRLCQTIIKIGGQENLVFIGENRVIRKGILKNLVNLSDSDILLFETPVRDLLGTLKNAGILFLLKAYFLVSTIYHVLLARHYRLKPVKNQQEGLVLICNWVDPRSFSADGEYRDNYFGDLALHLKNKGKKVFIIPYILYTVPYRATLKKIVSNLDRFLLAESFLTVPDVCRIFFKTLLNRPANKVYPLFEGIDISEEIMHDLHTDWKGTGIASNLLLYEVVKRWKNAGISIETFIYPYENQVWEKTYCLALRKYFPSTRIIGYQHSSISKMFLNHFFAREELPVLPFPDKVITTGKYAEKLFKESGYDRAKVICGGAIRYVNLLKKKSVPVKKDNKSRVILVTPSIDRNETIDLVWKVIKAFGQIKEYSVVFKFHPDCPYRFIAREIGTLPKHFIISEQPTDKLLQDSDLLIYNSTTTSIEALALGVPVLHIKSDFVIDRDNLSDFPASVSESASTAGEILEATERLINLDERHLARKRQLWSEIVAEMFGPVDENTFDLFL